MRIEQLKYLIEISKCKSMSVASENLHLTPQALSISIKNLEEELGVQLLERTNKGASLTQKGWLLTKLTEEFLNKVNLLVKEQSPNDHSVNFVGEYNICTTFGGANAFLPNLIVHFLKEFPDMHLSIHTAPYYEVYDLVSKCAFPYSFFEQYVINGTAKIPLKKPLEFHPLFRYHISCQIPTKFPASKYDTISLEQMMNYPYIEYSSNDNTPPSILPLLKQYGTPKKIFSVDSSSIVKTMLSSGLGISMNITMPFQDTNRFHLKNVKSIPIKDNLEIYFGYITSSNNILSNLDEEFLSYINDNLQRILTENN